jgi:hypothetical protein
MSIVESFWDINSATDFGGTSSVSCFSMVAWRAVVLVLEERADTADCGEKAPAVATEAKSTIDDNFIMCWICIALILLQQSIGKME